MKKNKQLLEEEVSCVKLAIEEFLRKTPSSHAHRVARIRDLLFSDIYHYYGSCVWDVMQSSSRGDVRRELGPLITELLKLASIDEIAGIDKYKSGSAYLGDDDLNSWRTLRLLAGNGIKLFNLTFRKYLQSELQPSMDLNVIVSSVDELYLLIFVEKLNKQNLSRLIKNDINLNVPAYPYEYHDLTPLSRACMCDAPVEIIQLLLEHGADVNTRKNEWEDRSPILWACQYVKDVNVIKLLLDYGANANEKHRAGGDRDEHSALAITCIYDKPAKFIEVLLDYGADAKLELNYDVTAIRYCFGYADYSMDFDPEETETKFENSLEAARILMRAGAEVDERDLENAIHFKAPEKIVNFLLAEGDVRTAVRD